MNDWICQAVPIQDSPLKSRPGYEIRREELSQKFEKSIKRPWLKTPRILIKFSYSKSWPAYQVSESHEKNVTYVLTSHLERWKYRVLANYINILRNLISITISLSRNFALWYHSISTQNPVIINIYFMIVSFLKYIVWVLIIRVFFLIHINGNKDLIAWETLVTKEL